MKLKKRISFLQKKNFSIKWYDQTLVFINLFENFKNITHLNATIEKKNILNETMNVINIVNDYNCKQDLHARTTIKLCTYFPKLL